jgi:hypothetical protein
MRLTILITAIILLPTRAAAAEQPLRPLPRAIASRIDSLTAAAAAYRGLKLEHPVTMGQVTVPELSERIHALVDRELSEDVLSALDRALTDFGLLPTDYDLVKEYPKLLTGQIAGFYDPKQKDLVLTDRPGGLLGPEAAKTLGPAATQRIEDMAIVHEITHAIQDQHFSLLGRITDAYDPLADSLAAETALCEGDATLVMYSYLLGIGVERLPALGDVLASAASGDPARRTEMLAPFPGVPGAEQLAGTPAYLRESLVFPYLQGFVFTLAVRQVGGEKLLDYAFAQDPPSSSEQVMHPQKWFGTRDAPILIGLDAAIQPLLQGEKAPLAGYQVTARGTHGELGIQIWLTERLGQSSWQEAQTAAAGWGGDQFLYLEPSSGPSVIVWVTEWDTVTDADDFAAAAARAPGGAPESVWQFDRPSPTRVTLVRGALSESAHKAIVKALAEAEAAPRSEPSVDLQALGIGPGDRPQPPTPEELMQLLQNPLLQGIAQGMGLPAGAK